MSTKKQKLLLSRGSFLFFAFASSHQTSKNGHHHFVIDFHQIFRKSINPSTNLTSHGDGIFSIWKKILKYKSWYYLLLNNRKEGKDESNKHKNDIWENQRNVKAIIIHYWLRGINRDENRNKTDKWFWNR